MNFTETKNSHCPLEMMANLTMTNGQGYFCPKFGQINVRIPQKQAKENNYTSTFVTVVRLISL